MAMTAPTDDEVRAALKRIVTSSEFLSSPHLAAFLRFSVEKSLAGEGQNIKAYSIATGVLGRPPTFDPQADPIVRVEATRLRRAMERYYLHDGADDPVLIDIPRGRYIAYFSYRECKAAPADPIAPRPSANEFVRSEREPLLADRIHKVWSNFSRSERRSMTVFALALMGAVVTWGVVPLWDISQKPVEQALMLQPVASVHSDNAAPFATGTTNPVEAPHQRIIFASLQLSPFDSYSNELEHHDLSHRLTHMIAERAPEFEGIPVFDPDGPMPVDPPNEHLYALLGTILRDAAYPDRVEISVRLIQRPSYEIIWAKSYDINSGISLFDDRLAAIRDDIVQSIAGLNGAIRVDDARRHIDDKAIAAPCQLCLAESDIALRMRDPERIAKAIACLSALSEKRPSEALIFKQLAALRLMESQNSSARVASVATARRDLETAISLAPSDKAAREGLVSLTGE